MRYICHVFNYNYYILVVSPLILFLKVFIRELISNSCDALERLRYLRLSGKVSGDSAYEIHLATDETNNRFILADTGVGMTKQEMIQNLGIIARSGTREFLERVVEGGTTTQSGIQLPGGSDRATTSGPQDTRSNLIGQFGVGFYGMIGRCVNSIFIE